MAHEMALQIVNTMQDQMALLARSIVMALRDKKVDVFEGMQLTMQGAQLATYTVSMLKGLDEATRADILYVLEHGDVVLKE